jgi:hypothetical protein
MFISHVLIHCHVFARALNNQFARTRKHVHVRDCILYMHTITHTNMHAIQTCTHTYAHRHARTHIERHTQTDTHTLTHKTQTNTNIHAHTNTIYLPLCPSCRAPIMYLRARTPPPTTAAQMTVNLTHPQGVPLLLSRTAAGTLPLHQKLHAGLCCR